MNENTASDALKNLILKRLEKRKTLDEQINVLVGKKSTVDEELISFNESYKKLTGESLVNFSESQSIADLVEDLLREHAELTADQMIKLLAGQGHIIKKQSLVATLVRYAARRKRFRRAAGRNRFGLLEPNEEA